MSGAPTVRDRWRAAQRGWPPHFPLVQFPNPPLLAAIAGWLVAAVAGGTLHDVARAVFYVGLAAWAWEELSDGANWVRRLVGAGGLVFVVVAVSAGIDGA